MIPPGIATLTAPFRGPPRRNNRFPAWTYRAVSPDGRRGQVRADRATAEGELVAGGWVEMHTVGGWARVRP